MPDKYPSRGLCTCGKPFPSPWPSPSLPMTSCSRDPPIKPNFFTWWSHHSDFEGVQNTTYIKYFIGFVNLHEIRLVTDTYLQGCINVWTELLKWMFRLSHHTLPGLLLGVLEKLNSQSKRSEDYPKLLTMCTDLKQEIKVWLVFYPYVST